MNSLAANLFSPTKDDFGIDSPSKTSKNKSTKSEDKGRQFRAILENSSSQASPISNDPRGERKQKTSDLADDGTLHAHELLPETSTKHSDIDTPLAFMATFNEQSEAKANASENVDLDLDSNDVPNGHDLSSRVVNGPIRDTGEHPTFVAVDSDTVEQWSPTTLTPQAKATNGVTTGSASLRSNVSLPATTSAQATIQSSSTPSPSSPLPHMQGQPNSWSSTTIANPSDPSTMLLPQPFNGTEQGLPSTVLSSKAPSTTPHNLPSTVLSSTAPSTTPHNLPSTVLSSTAPSTTSHNLPPTVLSSPSTTDPKHGWALADSAMQDHVEREKLPKASTTHQPPSTEAKYEKPNRAAPHRAKLSGATFSQKLTMKQDSIDGTNPSSKTDTENASDLPQSSTSSHSESDPPPAIRQSKPTTTLGTSRPTSDSQPHQNAIPATQGLTRTTTTPLTVPTPMTATAANPDAASIDVFDHMPFSAVREVIDQAFHSLRPLAAGGAELSMNVPELGQLKLQFEATDTGFTVDLQTSDSNLAEQINRESVSFAKLFRLDGKTVEMQASTFAEHEEGTNFNDREESDAQHSDREYAESQHSDPHSNSFAPFSSNGDSEEASDLNIQQHRPPSNYGLSLVDEMA